MYLKFKSGQNSKAFFKEASHVCGSHGEPTLVEVQVCKLKTIDRAIVKFYRSYFSEMRGYGGMVHIRYVTEHAGTVALARQFLQDDQGLFPALLSLKEQVPASAKTVDRFLYLAEVQDVQKLKREEYRDFLHKFRVGDTVVAHLRYQGNGLYYGDEVTVTLASEQWNEVSRQWVYQTTDGRRVVGGQLKKIS